jgi:hypothetical protein
MEKRPSESIPETPSQIASETGIRPSRVHVSATDTEAPQVTDETAAADRGNIRKVDVNRLFSAPYDAAARTFEPDIKKAQAERLAARQAAVIPPPVKPEPAAEPEIRKAPILEDKVQEAEIPEEHPPADAPAGAARPGSWKQRIEQERARRAQEKAARKKEKEAACPPLLDEQEMNAERQRLAEREAAERLQAAEAERLRQEARRAQLVERRKVKQQRRAAAEQRRRQRLRRRAGRKAILLKNPSVAVNRAGGYAVLAFACIVSLIQLIRWRLPWFSDEVTPGSLTNYAYLNLAVLVFALLLPLILFTRFFYVDLRSLSGRGTSGQSALFLSSVLGVVAGLGLRSLHNVIMFSGIRLGLNLSEGVIPVLYYGSGWLSTAIMLLISAALPALLGELFFRGLCQAGLSVRGYKAAGMTVTVLLSTFSIYQSLFWVVPLGLALLAGRLRVLYDDIKPAVFFRLTAASVLVILQNFLPRFTRRTVLTFAVTGRSMFYASIVVLVISALCVRPLYKLLERMSPAAKAKRLRRNRLPSAGLQTKKERRKKGPVVKAFLKTNVHWSYWLAFVILVINTLLQI